MKGTFKSEKNLSNGLAVRIVQKSLYNWAVSVECRKPLELFQNINTIEEANIIANQLYDKYECFETLMQLE